MRLRFSLWWRIFLFLLFPSLCFAQSKKTIVAVVHEGQDSVGQGVAFALKEAIRASQGFVLVDDSGVNPRVVARIVSVEIDVAGRGNSSSVGTAILYDSGEMPASKIFLNLVTQFCGRERIEWCARSILMEIDRLVDRLWKNR